ncbi:hypothetical protein FOA43_000829 [Brettanomyces nanus]|uniref:XPG-I domain-containing protein n=1 Tax=Eeniella nana TaxID=13502 RepID=A0A875RXX9_EENNA|nr:uncharacterized protein FOA43_000829 [Brettanomyces nanus]QPG73518.1 hypothetical protein FOA43_000829 [Brettanomyces nanus]
MLYLTYFFMTIPGLWDKLVQYDAGDERVPLRIYAERFYIKHHRPLKVGVDAYMWMFELAPPGSSGFGSMTGDMISKLVLNFHSRIRELIRLNVSFVLVFDGPYKVQKRRWETKDEIGEDLDHHDHHFIQGYSFMPEVGSFDEAYESVNDVIRDTTVADCYDSPSVKTVKDMLEDWNITYVQAPAEAEAELGRLNSCGVIDGIISNDGDGLMFGAQLILRNFSKWVIDAPSGYVPSDVSVKQQQEFYVTPFSMVNIEKITGLTRERVIFIACLGGNDFSGGAGGLGIARAFSLAQIGSSVVDSEDRKDFASIFQQIFVNPDDSGYIRGQIIQNFTSRKKKLDQFSKLLDSEINKRSREYFGRAHNIQNGIILPSDFYIMIHFYPLLAQRIYMFSLYDTNNAGIINSDDFHYCILPQRAAVCNLNQSGYPIRFLRSTGSSVINSKDDIRTITDSDQVGCSPICWFRLPDFKKMCEYRFPVNKTTREFLVKSLSEAYVFRAIEEIDQFRKAEHDLFINSLKLLQLPMRRKNGFTGDELEYKWTTELYQVKYNGERLFAPFLVPEVVDDVYDENYNLKSPDKKNSYVWIQKYLVQSTEGGRRMIAEYEKKQKDKQKTYKKGSPKKRSRKLPRQSSTLDNLKVSPIKISPKRGVEILSDKPNAAPLAQPLEKPRFTGSRPSSKDDGITPKLLPATDSFWMEEDENDIRTRKRPFSTRSPPAKGTRSSCIQQPSVNDCSSKGRQPLISFDSPPGLPRMKSKGAELTGSFKNIIPIGINTDEVDETDALEIIDLSSDSEDGIDVLKKSNLGQATNKTAEAKVVDLSEQENKKEQNTADSSLVSEEDSSIENMENEINEMLGLVGR